MIEKEGIERRMRNKIDRSRFLEAKEDTGREM
jgi:hypothetical protein